MSSNARSASVVEYVPGIPAEILGKASLIRKRDDGPYYMYSPGVAIHRVDARDGLPHLYAGIVKFCGSYGNWEPESHIEKADVAANRQTPNLKDPSQPPTNELCIKIWASDIIGQITKVSYKERQIITIDAFYKKAPHIVNLGGFNQLIAPKTIAWEWVAAPGPNGRWDDVPPKRMTEWERSKVELFERIQSEGAITVRRSFVEEALRQLLAGEAGNSSGFTELWVAACEQIIGALDAYKNYAIGYLQKTDAEIEEAKAGNADKKKAYDVFDQQMKWLTGYKPAAELMVEAARKATNVQVVMPEGVFTQAQAPLAGAPDIERKKCPRCKELIAAEAMYCKECKLDLEEFHNTVNRGEGNRGEGNRGEGTGDRLQGEQGQHIENGTESGRDRVEGKKLAKAKLSDSRKAK